MIKSKNSAIGDYLTPVIFDRNETDMSFWSSVPIVFWHVFASACDVFGRGASRPVSTIVKSKNSATRGNLVLNPLGDIHFLAMGIKD